MNVFTRELRANRRSVIIWLVSIVLFIVVSMAKFSTLTADGMDARQLLDQLPATVQALFGMNGLDITTIVGYFGVLYLYLAVMMAIQAGLLGADLIAKEEQDRTTEFLYVKPRSRATILTAKLAAGLVALGIVNVATLVISFAIASQYVPLDTVWRELALYNMGYGVIQLLFMATGVVLAAGSRYAKRAGKIVSAVIFVTYFIYVAVTLQPKLPVIGALSPFVHLDAPTIIANQALEWGWVALYLIFALFCVGVAYARYTRRDLSV